MAEPLFIQLPFWVLPFLILPVPVAAGLFVRGMRQAVHQNNLPQKTPDWSVPVLADTFRKSPVQRWEVRCKIITLLVYAFAASSVKHPAVASVLVVASVGIALAARISLSRIFFRLSALAGFLGMFFLVLPLTVPVLSGDTVVVFGGLDRFGFNLRGLRLAALVAARAAAVVLVMDPLFSTAHLTVTLHGMKRLGAPEMLGQMILLSHRYVHVFRHEARRLWAGMQLRGFYPRTDRETLKALGNFCGMLFIRSFERTERVLDAMKARGYTGRFPEPEAQPIQAKDLVMSASLLGFTAFLLALDRMIL